MKKFMTLLCLTALATLGFQANAELWLIGAISPDGWVTNKGVQFEQVDQNNYKLELDVTATGNQYYSLTTQLGNSWDAIKASRFGGSMEVALDTPTVLEAGTDQSPYTNFTAGTFVFEFNISTRTLTVSKKQDIVVPTFNGTVYITKTSIGNIWAWDGDGDYFDAWPGKAINTLETATVQGNEYYTFTYTHNSTNPGLIFNDGSAQTDNLVPEDGKLYDYTGGTTVSVSEPGAPDTTIVVEESLALRGSFNEWGETAMTKGENGLWTITQEMEAGAEFKFYDEQGNWIGGEADGNFVVTKEQVENGTALTLLVGAGNNFQIPVAGTWTLTVNKAENTLVVSGVWPSDTPDEAMYLIGSFNEWNTETQVAMTKGDDGKWTVKQAMEAGAEFKLRNELGTWIGAQSEGNFIVTKEQVANGDSLTIGEGDAFQNFEIPVAGEWTITVDREAMKLVIAGEWDEPVVEQAMYLIGSFNEWSDSTKVAMTKGENGLWTVAQEMAADAEFKFVDEAGNWYGGVSEGNFIVTKEQVEEGTALSMAIPGENFQIPVAGNWTLTVNRDSMQLVIAGEWNEPVVEPAKVYILGEVNENGGWFPNVGTEMATEDGETYTATITTKGENVAEGEEIGYSYFSFTTELAENDDEGGWAYIEPFRFGAVSEGDFWVTDDMFDTELDLTNENGQAFKIEAGEFELTLNLTEMTLVIKKVQGQRGDINGDGFVDVDDLNMLINAILADKAIAGGDLNNDGNVDIDDVNTIINLILAQ